MYVIGKGWDCSSSSDWLDPLYWTENTVPDGTKCVFIPSGTPNDPIIGDNDDGDGFSLTVENGASLNLKLDLMMLHILQLVRNHLHYHYHLTLGNYEFLKVSTHI